MRTLTDFAAWAAGAYPQAVALRYPGGQMSYVELAQATDRKAKALASLGVERGDKVALLADTSPEWTVCDLAIAAIGAVCVPVYPTNSAEENAWVLSDSGTSLVVCGNEAQRSRAGTVPAVMLGELTGDAPYETPVIGAHDINTIIYTSGTTGPPKGCLLTHANWFATLEAVTSLSAMTTGSTMYLYLPLAHMFARTVQFATLYKGATLVYWGGEVTRIVDELAELKPTHVPSVPRLFEKAYARVASMLNEEQRAEYGPAIVRSIFGGNVVEALTGGAPIAREILEFFQACGVPIYEAYGLTEATALISANTPGATKYGTVGRALPGVEIRIAGDGEVLTRGEHVFPGYHNNPQATADTIRDGWLHTCDLGELDDEGYLSITGRKKDLIITSAGKNLSPANMENDLRQCRWISQAVMYGDRRPYAVALITIDREETERAGLSDAEARALISQHVEAVNERYAPPERVRKHAILDHDFSPETGDLTPSLKVRRKVVFERYAGLFESLYGN
jgi:long-chain acyl-CoA synthetase